MIDLHVIHAIGNGINYFKKSRLLFDPLFPTVSADMKARMFAYLNNNKIALDTSFNTKKANALPLITVEHNEHSYDSQGLGNASHSTYDEDGRETKYSHLFTSQDVVINMYAKEMETLRMMHRLVISSMLLFHPSFINAGYQNLLYVGSTSMELDEKLFGENFGVYGRSCRYAALHLLQIPARIEDVANIGALEPLLDIQVQPSDVTPQISGVQGGVVVKSF
jgi:hypothetical protein